MEQYVNLSELQVKLEDALFSVRWINSDHKDTPLTGDDYAGLNVALNQLQAEISTSLKTNPSEVTNPDYEIQNFYESNHIKSTRDRIFIKAVNVFLQYCKNEGKTFDESHLEAAYKIATDSIEKLYKVKI